MSTSTQQPEAPTSGPKTTLTVPAKPAAITGANLLALAGTAAVAGGPVGWLAAGAVLGAPVAVLGARRAYRNRAERKERTRKERTDKTSTSGSPGRGKGLFGKSPRSGGGSGSGTGKQPGRGGSGQPGGRHAAGSPGSGRSGRNPLGRLLPSGKGRGGPPGSGSGGPGKGRGGRGGGQPGGKKGFLPKWLRGKNDAPGGGKGGGKNGPGGSGTSGPGGKKKRGGPSDGTVRKWGPCNGIEDRHGRSGKPGSDSKPVKPNVNRGPQQRGPGAKPPATRPAPARPGAPVRLPGQPTRTTPGGDMSAGTREAAGRMWANTAVWEPKGMLDAVEEFHDLPQSLAYVRATVGTLMEKSAGRLPLDSAIAKQIGQIVALLDTAAKMAPKVPEAIEAIHKAELDRLRRPRAGESKWDRAANGLA